MRKRTIPVLSAVLLMITLFLCSCAGKAGDIKLPDAKNIRQEISRIIEDRFDEPVLLSEAEDHNIWEVNLPDRNELKVLFKFYKNNPSVGMDGSEFYNYWEMRTKTNYVKQIISSFDNSLKADIDRKYGIIPDSTEVGEKFETPAVTVHTAMSVDELTTEKSIDYINECMKLYDFRAVQFSTPGSTRTQGVETLHFTFVFDNEIWPDGKPFEYDVTICEESLSTVKLTNRGEYINEKWIAEQMDRARGRYLRETGKSEELTD